MADMRAPWRVCGGKGAARGPFPASACSVRGVAVAADMRALWRVGGCEVRGFMVAADVHQATRRVVSGKGTARGYGFAASAAAYLTEDDRMGFMDIVSTTSAAEHRAVDTTVAIARTTDSIEQNI